jgi:hypothetical protein
VSGGAIERVDGNRLKPALKNGECEMKKKRVWWVLLSLAAVLILTAGALWAMDMNQGSTAQEASQLSAVPNKISYQGVYSENGIRVTGSRNMAFQFFNNSNCGDAIG